MDDIGLDGSAEFNNRRISTKRGHFAIDVAFALLHSSHLRDVEFQRDETR
jgi:hypothetical protein